MVTAPHHRECEILDRQHTEQIEPAGQLQQEREGPEQGDRDRQYMQGNAGLRVQRVQIERDGIADQRPEDVADQEHARPLMRFVVALDLCRDEPVQHRINPGGQDHQPIRRTLQRRRKCRIHREATFLVAGPVADAPMRSPGNTRCTFVPCPGWLSSRNEPPCFSIMDLTSVRPSPAPAWCRLSALFPCTKGCSTRGRSSPAMPIPLSATVITNSAFEHCALMLTTPPELVNFTALPARFSSI